MNVDDVVAFYIAASAAEKIVWPDGDVPSEMHPYMENLTAFLKQGGVLSHADAVEATARIQQGSLQAQWDALGETRPPPASMNMCHRCGEEMGLDAARDASNAREYAAVLVERVALDLDEPEGIIIQRLISEFEAGLDALRAHPRCPRLLSTDTH